MSRKITFVILFLLIINGFNLYGQGHERLEFDFDWTVNNTLEIRCKPDPSLIGSFSVNVEFEGLKNMKTSSTLLAVTTPGSTVRTIEPADPNKGAGMRSYSYWYIRGRYNLEPEREFVYALPYRPGKEVRTRVYWSEKSTDKDRYHSYMFLMERGDTICATRRGLVVVAAQNEIVVEHRDGTLGTYLIPKGGFFLVKMGDNVLPGSPMAVVGSVDYEKDWLTFSLKHARFNKKLVEGQNIMKERKSAFEHAYVSPIFATSEGNIVLEESKGYSALFNDTLLCEEMSKREINKLKGVKK